MKKGVFIVFLGWLAPQTVTIADNGVSTQRLLTLRRPIREERGN